MRKTHLLLVVAVAVLAFTAAPIGVSAWPTPCQGSILAYYQAYAALQACLATSPILACGGQVAYLQQATYWVELNCNFAQS